MFPRKHFNLEKVQCVSPAVEEGKEPVVVLEEGEDVDGDGGEDEHQVEHCKSHQQPIECVLPQLKRERNYAESMLRVEPVV